MYAVQIVFVKARGAAAGAREAVRDDQVDRHSKCLAFDCCVCKPDAWLGVPIEEIELLESSAARDLVQLRVRAEWTGSMEEACVAYVQVGHVW